jgi:hypothetical protein
VPFFCTYWNRPSSLAEPMQGRQIRRNDTQSKLVALKKGNRKHKNHTASSANSNEMRSRLFSPL